MSNRHQLFCIPHSGGAALSYRTLQAPLAEFAQVVPLDLSGHGARMREPLLGTVSEHVEDLRSQLLSRLSCDTFTLFCHSLGSLIGYELVRALEGGADPCPERIFVSGRGAPDVPPSTAWHKASETDFAEMIRQIGGTPQEVFDNPDLLGLFLPILRADYRVAETYRPTVARPQPLRCGITALAGEADEIVTYSELARWEQFSGGPFRLELLPGGHFYWMSLIDKVAQIIREDCGWSEPDTHPDRETKRWEKPGD